MKDKHKKFKNRGNAGNWIGVGTAIGAAVFVATNEPTWIAVGIAVGAAIGWRNQKIKMKGENMDNLSILKNTLRVFGVAFVLIMPMMKLDPRRLGLEPRTMGI